MLKAENSLTSGRPESKRTRTELLKRPLWRRKSSNEITEVLACAGWTLGMKLENWAAGRLATARTS